MSGTANYGLPRWRSVEAVLAVVEGLMLLTGVGLIAWALVDAVADVPLDGKASMVIAAIGLVLVAYAAWALREELPVVLRTRLLVGPEGVQLDAAGETHPWSEIAAFEVTDPADVGGIVHHGAVLRLRGGRRAESSASRFSAAQTRAGRATSPPEWRH